MSAVCGTPRAVEAFPCGSRSITSTRAPTAARAGRDVDGRRRLADAALLVRDRQHPRASAELRRSTSLEHAAACGQIGEFASERGVVEREGCRSIRLLGLFHVKHSPFRAPTDNAFHSIPARRRTLARGLAQSGRAAAMFHVRRSAPRRFAAKRARRSHRHGRAAGDPRTSPPHRDVSRETSRERRPRVSRVQRCEAVRRPSRLHRCRRRLAFRRHRRIRCSPSLANR